MAADASLGPVEYIVVAFPGNKFKGEIIPALGDLVQSGLIRVMDLALVAKDADGSTVAMELEDLATQEGSKFAAFEKEVGDLLSEDDLIKAAEELEPNSSAAVLVWENIWARKFAKTLRDADGVLVHYDRIPYDVIEAVIEAAPPKE
jgi:translation initiation factor IF-2